MNATVVTCMLDIGRGEIGRDFSFYMNSFEKFSALDCPLVIYIEEKNINVIWSYRSPDNTAIRVLDMDDLTKFPYFDHVQQIRVSKAWAAQAAWMEQSPQYKLKYYNPLVMMKPFWLRDVALQNPFKTDYFYWLDAGIFSNRMYAYMGRWVARNLIPRKKFILFSFRYKAEPEANGIPYDVFNDYCGTSRVRRWVRGGLFGGWQDEIEQFTGLYDATLAETLENGHMGTEENILTILAHRYPDFFNRQFLWFNRFSMGICLQAIRKLGSRITGVVSDTGR